MSLLEDVAEFHAKFRTPLMPRPTALPNVLPPELGRARLAHLREEVQEYTSAIIAGNVAAQADALVDVVYVAIGNALIQGLPFAEVWDAVHRANLQKEYAPHVAKRLIKPPSWQPPDIAAILARHA